MIDRRKYRVVIGFLLLILMLSSNSVYANMQETYLGAGGDAGSTDSGGSAGSSSGSMFDVKLENGKPKIDGLGSQEANQQKVIGSFKKLAGTVGAISLPIYVIILTTLFVKISAESNPNKREEMIKHVIVVCIAIGLTALAGTIVAIAFKFF